MNARTLDCSDIDPYLGKPMDFSPLREPIANNDIRRWVHAMHYPNLLHSIPRSPPRVVGASWSRRKVFPSSPTMAMAPRRLAAFAVAACLGGCADIVDQATVTISYAPSPGPEQFERLVDDRKPVEAAFKKFSERNGYKCRAHVKRVEEITCRGPNDLHLTFQPSLNKKEFVAKFSWAAVAGRTHEEFMAQVLKFKDEFSSRFGADHVRLESMPLD